MNMISFIRKGWNPMRTGSENHQRENPSMISLATRGLLLSLGLVLALATARPAQAGSIWSGTICADPVTASEGFTGSFPGATKCEAVCKIAAGVCKAAVKSALSCQKDSVGGMIKAFATQCGALSGAEKDACVSSIKDEKASWAQELAGMKDTALANCAAFLDACIPGCSVPL